MSLAYFSRDRNHPLIVGAFFPAHLIQGKADNVCRFHFIKNRRCSPPDQVSVCQVAVIDDFSISPIHCRLESQPFDHHHCAFWQNWNFGFKSRFIKKVLTARAHIAFPFPDASIMENMTTHRHCDSTWQLCVAQVASAALCEFGYLHRGSIRSPFHAMRLHHFWSERR